MTELEWLACTEPDIMLEFLKGKASDRKLRLFACACCRRMWSLLDDDRKQMLVNDSVTAAEMAKKDADRDKMAVELAERCADGQADFAELQALFPSLDEKEEAACHAAGSDAAWTAKASAYHARFLAMYFGPASYPPGAKARSASKRHHDREQAAQCSLLRDIFGNAFQPVILDPTLQTLLVVNLAQYIYDNLAFDRLPTLADQLEEAGCQAQDILAHCRGSGPHARGCWVVDLLLEKT
jgi:hypothetical protein